MYNIGDDVVVIYGNTEEKMGYIGEIHTITGHLGPDRYTFNDYVDMYPFQEVLTWSGNEIRPATDKDRLNSLRDRLHVVNVELSQLQSRVIDLELNKIDTFSDFDKLLLKTLKIVGVAILMVFALSLTQLF